MSKWKKWRGWFREKVVFLLGIEQMRRISENDEEESFWPTGWPHSEPVLLGGQKARLWLLCVRGRVEGSSAQEQEGECCKDSL